MLCTRSQEQVEKWKRSSTAEDGGAAVSPEVSWTQLGNKLQSFVDSPPHRPPLGLGGAGDGGNTRPGKMEASSTDASQGERQSSVGKACEDDTPPSAPPVAVNTQHRGQKSGRGRGGRKGRRGRGGRKGRGGQNTTLTHQSKKYVLGGGELVNMDMLGVLGLLDTESAGPLGRTSEEVRQAEEEESPLPSSQGGVSPSGHGEGTAVDETISSSVDVVTDQGGGGKGSEEVVSVSEVWGDSEGPVRGRDSDDNKKEGDSCKNECDSNDKTEDGSNKEGESVKEEGEIRSDDGDSQTDDDRDENAVKDGDSERGGEAESERRSDSTVVVADNVGVAQELPVGEQTEEMVVTLSATAAPPIGEMDPLAVVVSEFTVSSDVLGDIAPTEVMSEPAASKPGKRKARALKDTSKAKKVDDISKAMENGTASGGCVDLNGKSLTLDACEEGDEPIPLQAGKRRKTISKLQTSFLPDVPAIAEVCGRVSTSELGSRARCVITPLPSPAPWQGTIHMEGIQGSSGQVQPAKTPQDHQRDTLSGPVCVCPSHCPSLCNLPLYHSF